MNATGNFFILDHFKASNINSRTGPNAPSDSSINIAQENIEKLEDGTFVGPSSCDEFTTALGSGQMVLSYSFYVPTGRLVSSTTRDLALLQIFRTRNPALLPIFRKARRGIRRYLSLVEELASTMAELYPGWRMRIYHNVTGVGDTAGFKQTFMHIS